MFEGRNFSEVVGYTLGTFDASDFTPNGSSGGTLTISGAIPAGSFPLVTEVEVHSAFVLSGATGNNTILVGVTGDTDAYMAAMSINSGGVIRAGVPTDPDAKLNENVDVLVTMLCSGVQFSGATGASFTLKSHCVPLTSIF